MSTVHLEKAFGLDRGAFTFSASQGLAFLRADQALGVASVNASTGEVQESPEYAGHLAKACPALISADPQTLIDLLATPHEKVFEIAGEEKPGGAVMAPNSEPTPIPGHAVAFDRHGWFCDLAIAGLTQRMRWINPGIYLHGEPGIDRRHVVLKQGFWVADTPLTPELYSALTGKEFNFKHPVISTQAMPMIATDEKTEIKKIEAELKSALDTYVAAVFGEDFRALTRVAITKLAQGSSQGINFDRFNKKERQDRDYFVIENTAFLTANPEVWFPDLLEDALFAKNPGDGELVPGFRLMTINFCLAPTNQPEFRYPAPKVEKPKQVGDYAIKQDMYGWYFDLPLDPEGKSRQRMRWIPPGDFRAGSSDMHIGRLANHKVRLTKGFWMADTVFSKASRRAVRAIGLIAGHPPLGEQGEYPQTSASYISVNDYHLGKIARYSEINQEEWRVSLPTEAQWEYAAKAGVNTRWDRFNFEEEEEGLKRKNPLTAYIKNVNSCEIIDERKPPSMAMVKSFAPNCWGLYQMSGGVREWCSDALRDYDEMTKNETNVDPVGVGEFKKALKGGSYITSFDYSPASRDEAFVGTRSGDIGFRFIIQEK